MSDTIISHGEGTSVTITEDIDIYRIDATDPAAVWASGGGAVVKDLQICIVPFPQKIDIAIGTLININLHSYQMSIGTVIPTISTSDEIHTGVQAYTSEIDSSTEYQNYPTGTPLETNIVKLKCLSGGHGILFNAQLYSPNVPSLLSNNNNTICFVSSVSVPSAYGLYVVGTRDDTAQVDTTGTRIETRNKALAESETNIRDIKT